MSSSSNNKDSGRDNTLAAAITAAGLLGIAAGMIWYSLYNFDGGNKRKRGLFKKMNQYDKSLLRELT